MTTSDGDGISVPFSKVDYRTNNFINNEKYLIAEGLRIDNGPNEYYKFQF